MRDQIKFTGLLDKDVAEKAGITKHAMDTYVGSRGCMPAADIAVKIAKVIGVSVEWLVTGEEAELPDSDIQTLIHYFSHLDEHDKKMILLLAQNMYEDKKN